MNRQSSMSTLPIGRAMLAVLVLAIGTALVGGPATAQTREAELAACAAIEREQARLACYDRVIRSGESDGSEAAAPTRVPTPEPAASPEPVRVQTFEPAASAEPAADPAPAPEAVPVEEFPTTRSERRAARRAERRDEEPFSVVVVQHVDNLSGLGVFVTDQGEIYDQISTQRSRYPDVPFAADLAPASRGSFWLTTEAGGRPVRVVLRD